MLPLDPIGLLVCGGLKLPTLGALLLVCVEAGLLVSRPEAGSCLRNCLASEMETLPSLRSITSSVARAEAGRVGEHRRPEPGLGRVAVVAVPAVGPVRRHLPHLLPKRRLIPRAACHFYACYCHRHCHPRTMLRAPQDNRDGQKIAELAARRNKL